MKDAVEAKLWKKSPFPASITLNTHADSLFLSTVILVAGLYVWRLLRIGWVPSDEGTLAQSALRVYQGQLPQRDFSEIYTGGLSFLHAFAFHCFGINLFSLRLSVFIFFLAWLPVVYYIARRFVSAPWAAAVTLTAVTWSYPNYPAAMPSWYNLFFATFGAAALVRYLEVRSRRWLFVAGVCGGLSVLVKVIGLYYIAAALLFFVFLEQSEQSRQLRSARCRSYKTVCIGALCAYLAILVRLIWPQMHVGEFYNFILPSAACVSMLIWRELGPNGRSSWQRFSSLGGLLVPFLGGLFSVVTMYSVPYGVSGSIGQFFHSVLYSAKAHASGLAGKEHAPGVLFACYGLATIALIACGMYGKWTRHRGVQMTIALCLAAVLACSIFPRQLQDTWYMAGTLTPFIVLLGLLSLLRNSPAIDVDTQRKVMLFLLCASLCSLVQYPFPYVTYFCYTAPITLLAVVAVVRLRKYPGSVLLGTLLVFFLAFGAWGLVAKHVFNPELKPAAMHTVALPRAGGLKVDNTTPDYESLVPFLQSHATNGLMYAGNDCPELYFLSGLRNPTRDDTGSPPLEVLSAIQSGKLRLVTINDQPFFAGGITSASFRAEVGRYLPNTASFGRFTVYWR